MLMVASEQIQTDGPIRTAHRIISCPQCGGKLSSDKNPYINAQGTAFRVRDCGYCHVKIYSKQRAEEITGIE